MKINLLDIPVIYINLPKDKQKNKNMKDMLKELGFKNVIRIDGILDPEGGRRGLSKAQYEALSKLEPPFIILEDDCEIKFFKEEIEIPDDTDAVYLGNSAWGFLGSYSGFLLRYKKVKGYRELFRVFNMLSSHAILYISKDYVDICKRTTYYCGYVSKKPYPMDIPFAEMQKYFNVYVFNEPHFAQKQTKGSMSNAAPYTNKTLTRYNIDNKNRDYYRDEII
jgi:hypothetical protein